MDAINSVIKMWIDNQARTKPVVKMMIIFFLLARAPARVNNDGWETALWKAVDSVIKEREKERTEIQWRFSYVT